MWGLELQLSRPRVTPCLCSEQPKQPSTAAPPNHHTAKGRVTAASPEMASASLLSFGPAWGPRLRAGERTAGTLPTRVLSWGLSQRSLMFTCDPAGPARRMELTGGEGGWSPASAIKALPDLPLLYSHQTPQVRAHFPQLQERGKRLWGGEP